MQLVSRVDVNRENERFVRGKERLMATGISIPASMNEFQIPMDWSRKTVDVFASRFKPAGFSNRVRSDVATLVEDVIAESDFDLVEPQAIRTAVQNGCSFVFVYSTKRNASGVRIEAYSPLEATAILDARGEVKAALALIDKDIFAVHVPNWIYTLRRDSIGKWLQVGAPVPILSLLVLLALNGLGFRLLKLVIGVF